MPRLRQDRVRDVLASQDAQADVQALRWRLRRPPGHRRGFSSAAGDGCTARAAEGACAGRAEKRRQQCQSHGCRGSV